MNPRTHAGDRDDARSAGPPARLSRRGLLRTAGLLPLAGGGAGCSAGYDLVRPDSAVRVAVAWSAAELVAFRRLIDHLDDLPGMRPKTYAVEPVPLGDDISTALAARGAGRVDVVMLPMPGLVWENRDVLEPLPRDLLSYGTVGENYDLVWRDLLFDPEEGSDPAAYGLPFKLAHESLVWYRTCVFAKYGLEPPRTWEEWTDVNAELVRRGVAPLAVAAADGWMLTLFFENVLLGHSPCAYRGLRGGSPRPWDHPKVRDTLVLLGQMWGAPGALSGGVKKSLVQQFPDAVLEVFRYHRAAMVLVPDFAEPFVRDFGRPEGDGCTDHWGIFAFPRVDAQDAPLIAGGDAAVLTRAAVDDAADLIRRLAHPSAPVNWIAGHGGFIPANRNTPQGSYTPKVGSFARQLHERPYQFDLSDQIGAIGGREGLWRVLQDLLAEVGNGHADLAPAAADRAIERLIALEDEAGGPDVDQTSLHLRRRAAAAAIDECVDLQGF
ncbi:ABC transporter substrate-binding protein [Actinopolymorpha sp. B11F2]|uniref:ABC transporter substrate-binding protein n=1 Tax=Actinopolymorpha sp. B11F2 TaxID=3160862 RepID=UPI0032E40048